MVGPYTIHYAEKNIQWMEGWIYKPLKCSHLDMPLPSIRALSASWSSSPLSACPAHPATIYSLPSGTICLPGLLRLDNPLRRGGSPVEMPPGTCTVTLVQVTGAERSVTVTAKVRGSAEYHTKINVVIKKYIKKLNAEVCPSLVLLGIAFSSRCDWNTHEWKTAKVPPLPPAGACQCQPHPGSWQTPSPRLQQTCTSDHLSGIQRCCIEVALSPPVYPSQSNHTCGGSHHTATII